MGENLWIGGAWRAAEAPAGSFRAVDPATGEEIGPVFPRSSGADVDACLTAACEVAGALAEVEPARIAAFFDSYAERIDAAAARLAAIAQRETGLPVEPRITRVEIPRTTAQLRQAAEVVRTGSWTEPVIDTQAEVRSCLEPLGKPVLIFGPNNFPFAFNAVAGGDFAAALAARNPVIAKAHPGHPATTRALAELAAQALAVAGLPAGSVQLLYDLPPELGLRMCGDQRLGAIAFTGARRSGLALKAAADAAGIPIYLELASLNPVVLLPHAIDERCDAIADELFASCTLGAGQFCTKPGLVLLVDGPAAQQLVIAAARRFKAAEPALLLGAHVRHALESSIAALVAAGARVVVGGKRPDGPGARFRPTLLSVSGRAFLDAPAALQREAFGPATLVVLAADADELRAILAVLDGSLAASVYSAGNGRDEELYRRVTRQLRARVGRLLDDRMPTGVAVSAAMAHGGPFPATSHPGFSSVGMPAAIRRFAALRAYDHVQARHLPPVLRDSNPTRIWRYIDRRWTQADIS